MLITGPPWAALAFLDRVWASQDPASGLPGDLMPQEPVWWGWTDTCPPRSHSGAWGQRDAPGPALSLRWGCTVEVPVFPGRVSRSEGEGVVW